MDTSRHSGKTALVTGAASGIGRATALRLANEGATVVAVDRDAEGLASLVAEHKAIVTVHGNLTDNAFIDELVTKATAVGTISLLVNNAGIMDHFASVTEVTDEIWDNVMKTNLEVPMRLCRLVIPKMIENGGGAIVNIASAAALGGGGAGAAYIASKHGVAGLTKHISFAFSPKGIRCNAVCPGGTQTNIGTSAGPLSEESVARQYVAIGLNEKMAQPDEIAAAVSWLLSSEASNVNGAIMPADGGWRAI